MVRLLALSLVLASLGTGCCHCYQRTWYPGRGPVAAALAKPIKQLAGCPSGCGEVYWGEWNGDPPDDFDPCQGPCCQGVPHARLCIWAALERLRGCRGDCLGYCCDGCGPGGTCNGSCGGCAGGSCGGGGMPMDYADGYMSGGQYAPAMEGEQVNPPANMQSAPMQSAPMSSPEMYQDPNWDSTPTRLTPGVPDPQSRGSSRSRSVQKMRYGRPPLRAVSHEEEVEAVRSPSKSSTNREEPALLEEVLPDPRSNLRR